MEREKSNRREFIKNAVAVGTASSLGFSTVSGAKRGRWKIIKVPATAHFKEEKKAYRSIPGIKVESLKSGGYLIKIDQKEHPPLTTSEKETLGEYKQKARGKSIQNIHDKVGSSDDSEEISTTDYGDYKIDVGQDDFISDMAFGWTDKSHSGDIILASSGKRANLTEDEAEASIITTSGMGSATRTAAIGCKFVPNGSGEVQLVAKGWYNGFMTAAASAGFDTRIHFHVKDTDTGSVISDGSDIYNKSASYAKTVDTGQTWFNESLSLQLNDRTTYYGYLVIEASVNAAGEGGASSDFGPQDGDTDNPDQCAHFTQLDFKF